MAGQELESSPSNLTFQLELPHVPESARIQEDDKPSDRCGIVGIRTYEPTYLFDSLIMGAYGVQHRGQLAASTRFVQYDGINRDEEMAHTFNISGAEAKLVHINDLLNGSEKLKKYQILGIPGGFSYGDDIVAGKILAVELISRLSEELNKFIERKDTAIIGVCNGFQVLVRAGLVPFGKLGEMSATLTTNNSGHFECRWVRVRVEKKSKSKFLKGLEDEILWYPVAHGEGKFVAIPKDLSLIEKEKLVAFRYVDENGNATQSYPDNPNGSLNAIVGISDKTGRVLGLMPHPECFVRIQQHPNWRRGNIKEPQGLPLFKNIVDLVKN